MEIMDLLQIRDMVLSDLAEFVPDNYAPGSNALRPDSFRADYELGWELYSTSFKMTLRQRRACKLLQSVGFYGIVVSPFVGETPKGFYPQERSIEDVNFFSEVRTYAQYLPEDEKKRLLDLLPGDSADRPLGNRERETLLVIIAALAKKLELPISQASKTAGVIENLTDILGVRVSLRTIEEKLKLIPDVLEKRDKS